jgi:hypothetical protein
VHTSYIPCEHVVPLPFPPASALHSPPALLPLTDPSTASLPALGQVDAETSLVEKTSGAPQTDLALQQAGAGATQGPEGGSTISSGGATEPRVLNLGVLTSGLERAVQCAAQAMERLAQAAAANVAAAAADAQATAAALQQQGGAAQTEKLAAAAADVLPRALRAARVAALAAEASKLLPAPVDIPISDTKVGGHTCMYIQVPSSSVGITKYMAQPCGEPTWSRVT